MMNMSFRDNTVPWALDIGCWLAWMLVCSPIAFQGVSVATVTLGLYGTNAIILLRRLMVFVIRGLYLYEVQWTLWQKITDWTIYRRLLELILDSATSLFCGMASVILAPGTVGGALGSFTAIMLSIGIFGFPYLRGQVQKRAAAA